MREAAAAGDAVVFGDAGKREVLLAAGSKESLNVKGAYFEVLGDMLGSLGVLVAAGIIILTGWKLADPLIGAGIGLLILPRTWTLLKQAIHILMEGTPPEVDVALLERTLLAIPGVTAVRDLHGGGIGVAVGGDHFDPEPLQLDGDLLAKFAGAQQQGAGGAGAGSGSKHVISPDVVSDG